jgi:hypothetical protein
LSSSEIKKKKQQQGNKWHSVEVNSLHMHHGRDHCRPLNVDGVVAVAVASQAGFEHIQVGECWKACFRSSVFHAGVTHGENMIGMVQVIVHLDKKVGNKRDRVRHLGIAYSHSLDGCVAAIAEENTPDTVQANETGAEAYQAYSHYSASNVVAEVGTASLRCMLRLTEGASVGQPTCCRSFVAGVVVTSYDCQWTRSSCL